MKTVTARQGGPLLLGASPLAGRRPVLVLAGTAAVWLVALRDPRGVDLDGDDAGGLAGCDIS